MSETEEKELSKYLAKDMAQQLNDAEAEIGKLKGYILQLENENRGLMARLQAVQLVIRP